MWHKETKPVDRALSELNRKIELVERQMREMGHNTGAKPAVKPIVSVAARAPEKSVKQYVKELLTPPAKRSTTPVRSSRRDLFDATDPMKDLEDGEPLAFAQTPAPDLFAAAVPVQRSTSAVGSAGEKLVHYLAAGTVKVPKPTLKRVQRETRNRFFMWIGLAVVALWLIIVVIR